MGDADVHAAMTGLQEVLPVLERAQHLLRDGGEQRQRPESRGWSSTWSDKPKACSPSPPWLHLGSG